MGMAPMMYMAIASTVASVYAQQQQASAQQRMREQQQQNILKQYAANHNQTNLAAEQAHQQTTQKLLQNNMAAQKAQATAVTQAGSSGVDGFSVGALLSDLAGEQGRYNLSVQDNYSQTNMALTNQRNNLGLSAQSSLNSLGEIAQPDYLGAGLRIASEVGHYQSRDQKWSKYYGG